MICQRKQRPRGLKHSVMKLGRENCYKRNKNVHNNLVLRVSPLPVPWREEKRPWEQGCYYSGGSRRVGVRGSGPPAFPLNQMHPS